MTNFEKAIANIKDCYCGYLSNEMQLSQSASGGLARALSEHAINDGWIVYGVSYTEDFRSVEYRRVEQISQLDCIKGSKYIDKSKIRGGGTKVYSQIAIDLNNNRNVLFIGLPCDVGVLKATLKKNNQQHDRLMTVDLICHGPTSPKVAEQYIDMLEKKHNSRVVDFSVRYKNPNWTPPYLRAVFENGKEFIEPFYDTEYGIAFSIFSRPRCLNCQYKGDKHQSDMTIGDYWGMEVSDPGYNRKGTSIAFTYNSRADELLSKLQNFVLEPADINKALMGNPMYWQQRVEHPKLKTFAEYFEKEGLVSACRHCEDKSLKSIIKRSIPKPLFTTLKSIYNKIK